MTRLESQRIEYIRYGVLLPTTARVDHITSSPAGRKAYNTVYFLHVYLVHYHTQWVNPFPSEFNISPLFDRGTCLENDLFTLFYFTVFTDSTMYKVRSFRSFPYS